MHKINDDTYYSNELKDLLLSKDMVGFWRTWNTKVGRSSSPFIIDGVMDSTVIAQKLADLFSSNSNGSSANDGENAVLWHRLHYLKMYCSHDLKLVNI